MKTFFPVLLILLIIASPFMHKYLEKRISKNVFRVLEIITVAVMVLVIVATGISIFV